MNDERLRGYRCPGCGHFIGLMCDGDRPGRYICPHIHQVFGPQTPIKRDVPKKPETPNKTGEKT